MQFEGVYHEVHVITCIARVQDSRHFIMKCYYDDIR
jgi:hypothetical protein